MNVAALEALALVRNLGGGAALVRSCVFENTTVLDDALCPYL